MNLKKLGSALKRCAFTLLATTTMYANVHIDLTQRQLCDLELILNGGFAPLAGFLTKADYDSVVSSMRLANGALWPMPIILDVDMAIAEKIANDPVLDLVSAEGFTIATMQVKEVWQPDKNVEAQGVFGSLDTKHPGTDYLMHKTKNFYVGGPVTKVQLPHHYDFSDMRKTPAELKAYFKEQGIERVVAFQTRNPMHRAHKELTERAAKIANAHLLLHPVVGLTKPGDVDHFSRVRCYKKLLKHYPEGSVTLSLLPLAMRMAGPREALWHALIRKNYGATHFIVGRDHAGPGKDSKGNLFYGPYDAQQLVLKYAAEIGITVLPFQEMLYVPESDSYNSVDELAAGTRTMNISGTELRDLLRNGKDIPAWFTYPDIAQELKKTFLPKDKQGFVVFFSGLSASGKSTVANALALKLSEIQHRAITMLDGDEVRKHLSYGLGFSREGRSTNIRRIGYVANEVSRAGGIAICAPIAPYEEDRAENRKLISKDSNYLEVYISTPLEACEQRDPKGLYKKARAGEVKEFTGISDPYEVPQHADIICDCSKVTTEDALNQIIERLRADGLIN